MTGARSQPRDRGIALINALVIVAALSALASGLMLRAGDSRARLLTGQELWQAMLYLDAAEPLAPLILAEDTAREAPFDHPLEDWGRPRVMEIDRGRVTTRLVDLQGRFNLNWLADPGDAAARRGFERLLARLDLPPALAVAVADHLRPDGPRNTAAYAARSIPVTVAGGPVVLPEEIRLADGMTPDIWHRLAPFVAALPPDTALNVNTAPPEVLAALLPRASEAALARLIGMQRAGPLPDLRPVTALAGAAPGGFTRFTLQSRWFEAGIAAELGDTRVTRRLILRRGNATEGVVTEARIGGTP